MHIQRTRDIYNLIFVLLVVSLAACKNPVERDDDHAEAEGLVLRMNGVDIVTVKEGRVTGGISVKVETETDHIEIYFLNPHGERFKPTGDSYSLGWAMTDQTIADVKQEPGKKWEIHIRGKKVGQTMLELRLLHAGHVDFRTPQIPVTVTP
jgi:hypothetical protein